MATTGFYDYRARVYDPRLGQFASEDPIGFTANDPNLRRYVGNEPTRYTDPSGLAQDRPKTAYFVQEDPEVEFQRDRAAREERQRFRSGSQAFFLDHGVPLAGCIAGVVTDPDAVQGTLDAVGMVDQGPAGAAADLASAGIDLWRGDLLGAFLGLLAALPVVGTGVGVVRKSRVVARAGEPVGGVLHATDAAAKGRKCVVASSNAPVIKAIPKTYERPFHFRKGVREKVWEAAKGRDGKVRDPLTGREMKFDEPWDMGHKPGYEFRKHQQSAMDRGLSRKEFLEEYNNPEYYRPELPGPNRSHRGELKTDDYFGK
jgi:hypothetical protein